MKDKLTNEQWEKIKFQNSLGPQIGGLIHDATALAIATKKIDPADIKHYLDMLYILAEQKKSQILKDQEPKPLTRQDVENAEKMGKEKLEVENQEEGARQDEIIKQVPF